jgi:hypothetical protein
VNSTVSRNNFNKNRSLSETLDFADSNMDFWFWCFFWKIMNLPDEDSNPRSFGKKIQHKNTKLHLSYSAESIQKNQFSSVKVESWGFIVRSSTNLAIIRTFDDHTFEPLSIDPEFFEHIVGHEDPGSILRCRSWLMSYWSKHMASILVSLAKIKSLQIFTFLDFKYLKN